MADNALTCTLCGGTDFTKEAGYYYCNECQTQSQEVQEHVFETEPDDVQPAAAKRTHSKRIRGKKKEEDQLTSWECYNYIILGLVNELIEMGAKDTLKQTIQTLWLKYLCQLEVLSDKTNSTPKLSVCNSKIDAEIIYGKPAKRKKVRSSRTPSPSTTDNTHDSSSLRRQHSKSKRSLVLAEYDEFSTTLKADEQSLQNQSLSTLHGGSDTSETRRHLQYSKSAKQELLRSMTKNHLKAHCGDLNSLLPCHNLSYRQLTEKYLKGPEVLSRKRIYALIYLGLLINKEKIQLGDMLRFIREGYLSYHSVNHFFPEEYENRHLNIKSWNSRSSLLNHSGIRVAAAKIAKFIGVTKYIPRQNLVELCQRYCTELNLPDEVWGYTLNLMSRVPPRLHFTKNSYEIPNYEGRALSMILFTVKLLFGLDDATEEYLSSYADDANGVNNERMFIWRNWAYYIIYRKLVLIQHHFPTQHVYDDYNIQHSDGFVNFLTEQHLKYGKDTVDSTQTAEVLKGLLEKLKDKQMDSKCELPFTSTLKPFRDYIQILLNSDIPTENNYLIDVLESNFKNDSLQFLANPYVYLNELHRDRRIGIKHRGANVNLHLTQIQNTKLERQNWRRSVKRSCFVQLCNKQVPVNPITMQIDTGLDTKSIFKHFEIQHMDSYQKRMSKAARTYNRKRQLESDTQRLSKKTSGQAQTNGIHKSTIPFIPESICSQIMQTESTGSENVHYIHYNPYDRFWLRSRYVAEINKEEFMDFFKKFPESFKLLFNECARISEQDLKEYFVEYNNVEIYLCYASNLTNVDKPKATTIDHELNKLITRAIKEW